MLNVQSRDIVFVTTATLLLGTHLSPSPTLSLFVPVQSDHFILQATEIGPDMGPWANIGKLGENIFFLYIIDYKLETSMEQCCYQMQKRKNEAKQKRDVEIDEEGIMEEEEGRERNWRKEEGREEERDGLDGTI